MTYYLAQHRKTVRIADFSDQRERYTVAKTYEYDHELVKSVSAHLSDRRVAAWLAAPVVIKEHSFAVIMLVNKRDSLSARFSETDQQNLQEVNHFLAGVIPSSETYRVLVKLSEGVLGGNLEKDKDRGVLYDLLKNMIPGLQCASLGVAANRRATAGDEAPGG